MTAPTTASSAGKTWSAPWAPRHQAGGGGTLQHPRRGRGPNWPGPGQRRRAILTYGLGPTGHLANGMVRIGWKVPMVQLGAGHVNFIDNAGPNAEGAHAQTFIRRQHPRRKAFIDKYRKAFGVERIPVAPRRPRAMTHAAAGGGHPSGPQHRRRASA